MTRGRCAALLCAAAALATAAPAQPPGPTRRALVIGIDRYLSDDLNTLKGAANDARRLRSVLLGRFQFPPENVHMLLDEEATRDAILAAIRTDLIEPTRPGDVVVLHFSGHGSQVADVDGDELDGWDETIVPHDSRVGTVFDITDDELHALLRELGAKTPHVTVILDSCHSGTGVRDAVGGRRRDAPRDRRRPPPAPPRPGARGLEARGGFGEIGANYVLISGALPHELSNESTFDGVAQGALSHFLAQALDAARDDATYRDVMDATRADVTARFQAQHPQIEGPGLDTRVFGTEQIAALPSVIVEPAGNGRVTVEAGELQGLGAGATLDVHPPGTRTFTGAPSARVRVTSASVFAAEGQVEGGGTVAAHSRAVLRGIRPPDFHVGVLLENAGRSPLLQAVQAGIADFDVVEVVASAAAAQLVVRVENGQARLYGTAGEALAAVDVALPDAAKQMAQRVLHWARWHSILAISNPSPTVDVDLRIERAGSATPQPAPAELAPGSMVNLVVENRSSDRLYVILLDLASDGSVTVLRPRGGAAEPLEPARTLTHAVRAALPPGRDRVLDVVKVIATTQPVQPSLFQLDAAPRSAGPPAGGDALTRYLRRAVRGQTRNLEQVVVDGWVERQRSLVVAAPRAQASAFALHMASAAQARTAGDTLRAAGARAVCSPAGGEGCYQVEDLGLDPTIVAVRAPAPRAGQAPLVSTGELFEEAYRLRREGKALRAEPLFEVDMAPVLPRWGLFEKGDHDPRAEADPLWSLKQVQAPQAWTVLRDATHRPEGAEAQGVAIAHPDTGYRPHPEIWAADAASRPIWAEAGYDYFGEDRDATDELLDELPLDNPAHGTSSGSAIVSPLGCQLPGAAKCPTGVARGARLVPLRVNRSVVHFDTRRLSQAIADASGSDRSRVGAATQVMSISMGGVPSWTLWQAVRAAEQRGYLVIAAAGNYVGTVVWPARFPSTIAVAATGIGCRPWAYTSAGPAVVVSAPGESVWRATLDDARNYVTAMGNGTTYATATVAGIAALWIARHQGSPEMAELRRRGAVTATFRQLVQKTAWTPAHPPPGVTCDDTAWDAKQMGAGIVDAARLLAEPLPTAIPRSAEPAGLDELPLFASLYPPATAAATVRADYRRLFAAADAAGPFDVYEAEVMHHYALDARVAAALDAVVLGEDRSDPAFAGVRSALLAHDLSPSLAAALQP